MYMKTNVLIVGGGIAGAALALSLGKKGYDITIIDRLKSFPHIYKGEFLQPYTLELLSQLGVLEEIGKDCVKVTKMTYGLLNGEKCITEHYPHLSIPIRYGLNGDHRKIHDAILNEALKLSNVTIMKGTQARKVLFEDHKVVGVTAVADNGEDITIRSEVVVGADGIKSIIRNQLQVNHTLYSYEEKKARICAFTLHLDDYPTDEVTFHFGKGNGCGIFPLPGNRIRIYIALRNKQWNVIKHQGVEAIREIVRSFYPELEKDLNGFNDMKQMQVIPSYYLHTEKWAVNGAVLLGDACHAVSPALGQGMNLAIQGAITLSQVLDQALQEQKVDENTLRQYEYQRRKYVYLIQQTSNIHTFGWLLQNAFIIRIRNHLFRRISKCPSISQTQLQIVAGYREKHPSFVQLLRLIGILQAR